MKPYKFTRPLVGNVRLMATFYPYLNRFLLIIACTFISFMQANAQNAVVKFNLVSLLQKNMSGAVEIKLSDKLTANANLGLIAQTTGNEADTSSVYSKESGFLVAPELRYYLGDSYAEAPNGFFVGGNFLYESAKLTYKSSADSVGNVIQTSGNSSSMGFGVIIGSQWIFSEHFAVELFFNPYYNIPKTSGDINTNQISDAFIRNYRSDKEGFQWKRIGLSIGVAF